MFLEDGLRGEKETSVKRREVRKIRGRGLEELLILTWNGKYQSGNSNYQEFPELKFREITNSMP